MKDVFGLWAFHQCRQLLPPPPSALAPTKSRTGTHSGTR